MTTILGIHDGHNATASLMIDGRIVAAISEERLTYRKNEMGFPVQAVKACLRFAGLDSRDLDHVVFSTINLPLDYMRVKREFAFTVRDWLDEQEGLWKPKLLHGDTDAARRYYVRLRQDPRFNEPQPYDLSNITEALAPEENRIQLDVIRKEYLRREFSIPDTKIRVCDHHRSHAHYAYYASPFRGESCLVFTNDSGGDGANGTVSVARNDRLTEIARNNESNIGRLYSHITLLLSMKIAEHEYKVMGLAPYASEYEIKKCAKAFDGLFEIRDGLIVYKRRPSDLFFYFRDILADCRFDGIAGAVQRMLEETGTSWIRDNLERHKISRAVFSGGVAMNVKLNKCIGELSDLQQWYVPASGGDESVAIGACYSVFADLGKPDQSTGMRDAYLGLSCSREEILEEVKRHDLSGFEVSENVGPQRIAALLAKGLVIGRLSGRFEFGARSLGNRSILADPSNVSIVRKINRQIKFRDFWMPFAPSVSSRYADRYLVNPKRFLSDHMTLAFDTTPEGRTALSAGLHPADSTVRAHIVDREINPAYFELIEHFADITGVGALLNTSFNLHGLPIVSNAKQALHVLLNSDLDGVVLEDVLVLRLNR